MLGPVATKQGILLATITHHDIVPGNCKRWNAEWNEICNGIWNEEMLKNDDKSMLWYSRDIVSRLLIPYLTQNDKKKTGVCLFAGLDFPFVHANYS